MEIVHVYTKLRSEFGRECLFSDRPAELLVDVPPDPSLALQFIQRTHRDQAVQACGDMSEHQVSCPVSHDFSNLTAMKRYFWEGSNFLTCGGTSLTTVNVLLPHCNTLKYSVTTRNPVKKRWKLDQ